MSANPANRARRCAVALAVAGLTGTGLVAVTAVPAQAAPQLKITNFGFDAQSYGSRTKNNPDASSDPTALSFIGCTRETPRDDRNFAASTGDGDGVALSNVENRNRTRSLADQTKVVSTSTAEDGTLGGGVIAFTDLKAKVTTRNNVDGYTVATSSTLGSLTVGGTPVAVPLDGTQQSVPTPDGGTLFINRQVKQVQTQFALGAVNVLRYEAADGTIEKVGRAFARMDSNIEGGIFTGEAFGTRSMTGDVAQTGKSARQPLPCPGTFGEVLVTRQAAGTLDFGNVGEQVSSVYGEQLGPDRAVGVTKNTIDRVGFGAALKFRNIKGRAKVFRQSDGDVLLSAKGTGVGTILVNGVEQGQPPAGQEQDVDGVGSYTVGVVDEGKNGLRVIGVTVTLENGTPADTSDDTVVDLGNARTRIKRS